MDENTYERLLTSSFRFLSVRPRSIYEVKEYLARKLQKWNEVDSGVIEGVLNRLEELEYLDDRKFAVWVLESRSRRSPRGSRLIERELIQKGINKNLIEEVLSKENGTLESELSLAAKAIQKKVQLWQKLPVLERKNKLYGFLIRRGFRWEIVKKIVDGVTKNNYNMENPIGKENQEGLD